MLASSIAVVTKNLLFILFMLHSSSRLFANSNWMRRTNRCSLAMRMSVAEQLAEERIVPRSGDLCQLPWRPKIVERYADHCPKERAPPDNGKPIVDGGIQSGAARQRSAAYPVSKPEIRAASASAAQADRFKPEVQAAFVSTQTK
jgi:hypothetical protein